MQRNVVTDGHQNTFTSICVKSTGDERSLGRDTEEFKVSSYEDEEHLISACDDILTILNLEK